MMLDEVREIISKFNKDEAILDQQIIESKSNAADEKRKQINDEPIVKISLEEAKQRNKELLKELELTKGRLRSKAIFSPTEIQWETICIKYQENPSLPVTTWRCHLPIFV